MFHVYRVTVTVSYRVLTVSHAVCSDSAETPGEPCSEEDEAARTACFCVLLHGGLKVKLGP